MNISKNGEIEYAGKNLILNKKCIIILDEAENTPTSIRSLYSS